MDFEILQILQYVFIAIFVLILIVCLSVASFAGDHVFEQYQKYNKHLSSSFMVASDFVSIVSQNFLGDTIRLGWRNGTLTDAYNSFDKTIYLSQDNAFNSSVAALTIAAHELGHAYQDFLDPNILKKHRNLGAFCKFVGFLMYPAFIAGIILLFIDLPIYYSLGCFGLAIGVFILALIFKFSTIKVEKQASVYALEFLQKTQALQDFELKYAKKFLNAALLTYIADFLRALLAWTFLTKKTNLFGG